MRTHEGRVQVASRRHGLLAFLRRKQWWSFEGLDPERGLYFVFLALQGFPVDYVSLKIIDYRRGLRWEEDHMGPFEAVSGDRVDVVAQGRWGRVRFDGRADTGWQIDLQTPAVQAHLIQQPHAPLHFNRLLARRIDYSISQFVLNETQGTVHLGDAEYRFSGYGYHEHNWGVQPRHSTAHWLHFWAPDMAAVVLSCYYDTGVPHHYTCFWVQGGMHYLFSPAQFAFTSAELDAPWQVKSPDLDLQVAPLYTHHTRMKIPPFLAYIDIDYYELLVEVKGSAVVAGKRVAIDGIGKYDHNFNRW